MEEKIKQKKYGTTRANISTVMNKGVDFHQKSVTAQVFTVLLVEVGTVIKKSKGSID